MKVIITLTTAKYAEATFHNTESLELKQRCNQLMDNFNKGQHIVCDIDENNSYSILN